MEYNFKNKKIYYKLSGKGRLLLLLHGFTESSEIWDDFTPILKKNYACLSIDLPGHGNSEALPEAHTMEVMAEIVKNIIDISGFKDCIMIGHSMGGYVALAFAEAYPEYLKGLCLFHSSALDDTPEIMKNRDKTIEIVKNNKFSFLSQFIPDLFAPENKSKFQNEILKLVKSSESMSVEGIINAIVGMKMRKNHEETLIHIKCPVLFIAGKKDSRVPLDKVILQIALPRHAESLILDNVGHMGYIEEKDLTLKTILFFANKIYF